MTENLRRADDERYKKLETKVDGVARDVSSIRDMLISEPEASPLGRALVKRADDNRAAIRELRDDFEPVYDWWMQTKGAWKLVLGFATVLGTIGAFFGILAFFGIRGGT